MFEMKWPGDTSSHPQLLFGASPIFWLGGSGDLRAAPVFEALIRLHKKFTRFLKGAVRPL